MPEPFDLEALVRAARPEPAPAWAGKMDRRVGGRGVLPPPRWWQGESVKPNLQAAAALGAVIAVIVAIVGVAGSANLGGDDSSNSNSGGSSSAKVPAMAQPEVSSQDSAGAAGSSASAA